MDLAIDVSLDYHLAEPTDLLLQIEVPDLPDQRVSGETLELPPVEHTARVSAEEGMGDRIWMRTSGDLSVRYSARVAVDRPTLDLRPLDQVPTHLLPPETVRYLMPSRYCPSDLFAGFVPSEFPDLGGGALIAAMTDWIGARFTYLPGASGPNTTAVESLTTRQGVCRDYAHVLVALARSASIPARFVSCYAPGVEPPDFHAVAEVYLDGTWHLVDATGMAGPRDIARIGVGADAADVAFLSAFGWAELRSQTVTVRTA